METYNTTTGVTISQSDQTYSETFILTVLLCLMCFKDQIHHLLHRALTMKYKDKKRKRSKVSFNPNPNPTTTTDIPVDTELNKTLLDTTPKQNLETPTHNVTNNNSVVDEVQQESKKTNNVINAGRGRHYRKCAEQLGLNTIETIIRDGEPQGFIDVNISSDVIFQCMQRKTSDFNELMEMLPPLFSIIVIDEFLENAKKIYTLTVDTAVKIKTSYTVETMTINIPFIQTTSIGRLPYEFSCIIRYNALSPGNESSIEQTICTFKLLLPEVIQSYESPQFVLNEAIKYADISESLYPYLEIAASNYITTQCRYDKLFLDLYYITMDTHIDYRYGNTLFGMNIKMAVIRESGMELKIVNLTIINIDYEMAIPDDAMLLELSRKHLIPETNTVMADFFKLGNVRRLYLLDDLPNEIMKFITDKKQIIFNNLRTDSGIRQYKSVRYNTYYVDKYVHEEYKLRFMFELWFKTNEPTCLDDIKCFALFENEVEKFNSRQPIVYTFNDLGRL